MPAQQDPLDRPEGLETRPPVTALPGTGERPNWLVGSEDVLQSSKDGEEPSRPTIADAPAARSPLRVIEGGNPAPAKGWSGAASSVPKLSVLPTQARPDAPFEDDESPNDVPGPEADLQEDAPAGRTEAPKRAEPAFRALEEPWYLVWGEAILTQRRIQVGLFVMLAAVVAFFFWPRGGVTGASLGSILRHPETYQGRSVTVHGEVLEIFEVGTGRAFLLRQGREVVVVYSTLREPRVHENVEVQGTVSTGYLDGKPRVAIFEGAAP